MKGFRIAKIIFRFSKTPPASLFNPAREKKIGREDGTNKFAHSRMAADEKLLESFKMRKNAEWEEVWKRSENGSFPDGDEDPLREVFVVTRKLLASAIGPLKDGSLRDDSLLEEALGKVHKRLPLPIRLIFWRKRYIQFILDNRERLIP